MMDWKSNTCETCAFRVDEVCRKSPPNSNAHSYPQVKWFMPSEPFTDACSQYKDVEYE